jgi:hypothetical protein
VHTQATTNDKCVTRLGALLFSLTQVLLLIASSLRRHAMTAHQNFLPETISKMTEYPIGIVFDVKFDAFAARLSTLPNSLLRFHIAEGPYAHTETVKIQSTVIRPGVFLVSWVEASGATVVHVEDFAQGCLYSHATLPDGTFLRMRAAITFLDSPVSA